MTPTKLLFGQILIVFAIVIGAVWGATQWVAAELDFQPRLGPAWFEIAGMTGFSRAVISEVATPITGNGSKGCRAFE